MIYLGTTTDGLVGLLPEEVAEFLEDHPDQMYSLMTAEPAENHSCKEKKWTPRSPDLGYRVENGRRSY
jgi:hypothetical protein